MRPLGVLVSLLATALVINGLPLAPQTAAAAAPARTSAQLRHSTAAWTKQKQQHPRAVPSAALPSILPDVAGKQNVTDSHNALRARHSAGPLVWDEQLARAAAAYARKCSFEPDAANENSGENLFITMLTNSPHDALLSTAVQLWYQGSARYNFSSPGYSSDTGSFTQVVWMSSTNLGCAIQRCGRGINGTSWDAGTLVTCRYSPPGNVLGMFRSNVLPPSRGAAADLPKAQLAPLVLERP